MSKPLLSTADLERAATRLSCTLDRIQVVCGIKSGTRGFDTHGRPLVRFEGDLFSDYTGGYHDDIAAYRHISHPPPAAAHYTKGKTIDDRNEGEHLRLKLAETVDRPHAQRATRWGRFMLLGADHAFCGHKGISSFVNAMQRSESAQLDCFIAYVQGNPALLASLRSGNVAKFFHLNSKA